VTSGRVLAVSGLAAAALWALGLTAWGPLVAHGGAGHAHAVAPALAAAGWLAGWALMATAMMLPAAAPLIGAVERRRALVAASYLAVWVAAGVAAAAAGALAGALALPAALAAAGAYQLSGHKRRALARCRGQRRLAGAGTGDGSGDAVRAGLAHGAATVRCCGPLMALMAVGLRGPAWMALLGGVMVAEATTPLGARLRLPLAAALLAAAVLAISGALPPGA
jgi:predicted metal-binding membrane protein